MVVQGCSLIDDDLSTCGFDYKMHYKMRQATDIQEVLEYNLPAAADEPAREAIRKKMAPIFSDIADDLDLSFYQKADDARTYYSNQTVNSNEAEFTFYLPIVDYNHLATANTGANQVAIMSDTAYSASARLALSTEETTVANHQTGMYVGRLPIAVADTAGSPTFEVDLYMVNSAVALVIDSAGRTVKDVSVMLYGTADGFMLQDSSYTFDKNIVVQAEEIPVEASPATTGNGIRKRAPQTTEATGDVKQICYGMVSFPSDKGWEIKVHVTLEDGTITETVLTPQFPLNPSELVVIKTVMESKGEILVVATTEVGATVTLDWKDGSEYEI